MTTTTTIRIDEDLKRRVAAAAERRGKSTHAFILDAIAETVARAEDADILHHLAEARWANLLRTGESVPWDDAKAWLEAKARGENPPRPMARKPSP
ncbi:CopG family ribbon-helix-helix protein [Plastoroseomonas arctica]|uniref:Ribbon-helix-helix protein, CopG family n=1 Tax=Plastoroseomonas arctica TaxID=1509237 RepID=A0AAF1K6Y2_9PROT|nr:ribbon-helix-helix protein, CopG family [Plastoroseomonas arctica]MBR0657513.1 ribbon-helix-helix protein, CopG family [Plastoroseomonas arctica]